MVEYNVQDWSQHFTDQIGKESKDGDDEERKNMEF